MMMSLASNWVCWAIVLVALVAYQQLFVEYLVRPKVAAREQDNVTVNFSLLLISVLPLMGLLGTIIGLLDCFSGMARGGSETAVVSGGIADALLTTQLGLVCAVPGWVLHAYVKAGLNRRCTRPDSYA